MSADPDQAGPAPVGGTADDRRAGDTGDKAGAEDAAGDAGTERPERRRIFSLHISPLTRRIVTLNLIALNVLVAGILYLNASREGLVQFHARRLTGEAQLIANVIEARLAPPGGIRPDGRAKVDGATMAAALQDLTLREGLDVFVYDTDRQLMGQTRGAGLRGRADPGAEGILAPDGLDRAVSGLWSVLSRPQGPGAHLSLDTQLRRMVDRALPSDSQIGMGLETDRGRVIASVVPIRGGTGHVGAVAVISPTGEIDALVRVERQRVLRMFIVALLVSVGLSLALASTISNPLAALAEAAELGRDHDRRRRRPGRIRIPDLSARRDEIGRLSAALRGMVGALYDRIDANEQFAADVAHEIKNPLASLHSAVGTLRMVRDDRQRDQLLAVIEHDVRRLDRLVSDISNASRLDAELVKEDQREFDLLRMLGNLNAYLAEDAGTKGIDYFTDLPSEPIRIHGLEARLAQVFVNLIANAISFCEEGDALRVWVRRRQNRVLVVIEDTGPGIPEEALSNIFKRFYSQRPPQHFGNNSGLGLAISKQIVEAHGGVIWAENIRPTDADIGSGPMGARFVVGLPAG
ncbi:sensor histidine kinase [Chachezhania sediminis]|uniref:sensor histidine kinase n=1 Tax=Chachezhania sediminis TaxID=2599291 RepID=UPI00131E0A0D|nr:sensor histidine kinase [Chachezhania sediminis]